MRFPSLLLTLLVAAPSVLHSQDAMVHAWPVAAGSRVRVVTPAFGKEEGTAVSVTQDALILRATGDTAYQPIPLAQVTKLDVSTGTYSRKGTFAGIGLLIGAGAGAIAGAASYPKPTCDRRTQICFDKLVGPGSRRASAVVGGLLLGLIGAAVGAFVGADPIDKWAPVAVPSSHSMRRSTRVTRAYSRLTTTAPSGNDISRVPGNPWH
jgi:hypothetical protein